MGVRNGERQSKTGRKFEIGDGKSANERRGIASPGLLKFEFSNAKMPLRLWIGIKAQKKPHFPVMVSSSIA